MLSSEKVGDEPLEDVELIQFSIAPASRRGKLMTRGEGDEGTEDNEEHAIIGNIPVYKHHVPPYRSTPSLDRLFVPGMMLPSQVSAYIWQWEHGQDLRQGISIA